MARVATNKLRTLYIMDELLEKSDEDNRISTGAFIEMLASNGIKADRKTLYDDIETLKTWGMDIIYTKEKPAGYYLASRKFELPELKLLVDAVQSSKFITEKKSRHRTKAFTTMLTKFRKRFCRTGKSASYTSSGTSKRNLFRAMKAGRS